MAVKVKNQHIFTVHPEREMNVFSVIAISNSCLDITLKIINVNLIVVPGV